MQTEESSMRYMPNFELDRMTLFFGAETFTFNYSNYAHFRPKNSSELKRR